MRRGRLIREFGDIMDNRAEHSINHRPAASVSVSRRSKRLIAGIIAGFLLAGVEMGAILKINATTVEDARRETSSYDIMTGNIPDQMDAAGDQGRDAVARIEKQKAEEEAARKAQEEIRQRAAKSIIHPGWSGAPLAKSRGAIEGPSGRETYYNLNMTGVVNGMRRMGFDAANYPYAVREDGAKMLGPYIMVAANLSLRPKGSLVQTSMGIGIVADTGGFAAHNHTQLDIATNW